MADIAAQDASLAAKKAQDSELVALKQQMDRLKGDITPGPSSKQKLRKACTDFEAVFISKLWEQMRATIPKDGMLHSPQEDMYRSMFDREFTEKMAQDGGIGLGDMLYDQLKGKLTGGGKATGKTDVQTLLSNPASRAVVQPATTGAVPEKPDFKLSKRGAGAVSQTSATAAASPAISPSSAASAATGPKPPASVPGAVMADVEALAQRIEADYDRRQAESVAQGLPPAALQTQAQAKNPIQVQAQASRYGQTPRSNNTGRRFATTG